MQFKDLFRKKSVGAIVDEAAMGLGDGEGHLPALKRSLGVRDLTAFGIAAVVGAGIFSTIGKAAADGGPAVSLLFIFTAIACAFSALCYAEFASMVPASGSAYTYAYVAFGELMAWIIGWDLLLEYAIGNVVVAISWSDYFTGLYNLIGSQWHWPAWPEYLAMDYFSARNGYHEAAALIAKGMKPDESLMAAYTAFQTAPVMGGLRIIFDLPALIIVGLITWLVYVGIRSARNASNAMVALKVGVVLLVIIVGAFYVDASNWSPFMPNGFAGVMKGASAVFFAYIGFDAISTTAEECKNPQRDLPRGIIYSLIICTILYVFISLVLTGMVDSKQFIGIGDPLVFVFEKMNVGWMRWIVGVSALVAISSVLLVFQMGQPRIWMSMSRDGLLPKAFSRIHPRYHTPSFSTMVTGLVVALPLFYFNMAELTDFTSIGTLFAFVLVCGGIIILHSRKDTPERRFRVPYINGQFIVPALVLGGFAIGFIWFSEEAKAFFDFSFETEEAKHNTLNKLPLVGFMIIAIALAVGSFMKKFSLIPVLGLLCCFYLMTELGYKNWERFVIWLVAGLVIYFTYSFRKSKLRALQSASE